ncbi:hypothetical protein ACEPAF_7170 [Sanghuangporus sanghuang]
MSTELDQRSCKETRDYCHELLKEISALVLNKLLLDIRSANFNYKLFKRGLDAFKRIERSRNYPEDDPVLLQAFSAAEALIKEFEEEYRSEIGIFKDPAHVDAHMKKMIGRLTTSKYVLINGPADMRRKVIRTWEKAYSEAKTTWDIYGPMEGTIENCYSETKEQLKKLSVIEKRVAQNQSGNYTNHDSRQLFDVAQKLRNISGIGYDYSVNMNRSKREREIIGKANDEIQKLMAEMTSLCKQVDDERKAKMDTNIKQLQKDKRSETHVKYEVLVNVGDAKFRADVCVRNGQRPMFCAAKSRPFEPPVGMRDADRSKWTPPTLEAQLATTNDPQKKKIVLKDLKASSSRINGSFSRKDIIVNLPQKKGPFSRTTIETSGSFGPDAGKHTAKVICTRKGTETCTGYLCKEPSCIHWIDSGIHPS